MSGQIDYYLSLISPWAYLGSGRLAELAARNGATVDVRPVDLGAIFRETGGLPLAKRAPARQAYRLVELKRWSAFLGIPIDPHPRFFPADETMAAHMTLAARARGDDAPAFAAAVGRACWERERNIADPDTLTAIAVETGLDGPALAEAALDPAHAQERERLTGEAVAAGVIGSPGYVFDGAFFWGQDRLEFLERAVAAS